MSIVSAIVLLAVIWWLTFFVLLPLRLETQGEQGTVEPGTHASAPANFSFKRKARVVTMVAVPLWIVVVGVIFSGFVTIDDFGWFHRMVSTPIGSN